MTRETPIVASTALVALFLVLNFSWTHAFAATAFGVKCPEAIKIHAKNAVSSLFGKVQSDPVFSCFNSIMLGLDISHGSARFAPLMPSILVLGPKGQNCDVAAHEYSHAELAFRTSALLRTYRIPTWFDEGLAMQVDNRVDYSRSALSFYLSSQHIDLPKLQGLSSPAGFYKAGIQGKTNYAFAKCVVSGWLDENGRAELERLIANVGWFQSFPIEEFQTHETICSS